MNQQENQQQSIIGPEGLLALILIAILPAMQAPGFSHPQVLRELALSLGGALVLMVWTGRLVWRQAIVLRGARWLAVLWIFVSFLALSAFWSSNSWRAISRVGPWVAIAAIALAVLAPSGRRISMRVLSGALAAGLIGGLALLAIRPGDESSHALLRAIDEPWVKLELASYAAIALPIGLGTALQHKDLSRVVGVVTALLAAFMLGSSGAEAPLWAALIGALFAQIAIFSRGHQALFVRTGLTTLIAALLVLASGALVPKEAIETEENPEIALAEAPDEAVIAQHPVLPRAAGEQRFLNESGMSALINEPLIGGGAGEAGQLIGRFRPQDSPYLRNHFDPLPRYTTFPSALVTIAAEQGLVGLLLISVLFAGAVWAIISSAKINKGHEAAMEDTPEELDHHARWGLLAAVGVAAALFMLTPMESLPASMALMGIVLAAAAARGSNPVSAPLDFAGTAKLNRFAIAALPLAIATLTALFSVRAGVGDYYRQWGNLYLAKQTPEAFQQATALYQHATAFNPGDELAYAALASSQHREGELEEAIKSLDRALGLAPNSPHLRLARGKLESARKHYRSATSWYTSALDLQPNMVEARLAIADIHHRLQEWEDAHQVLRATLELNPPAEDVAYIHYFMAKVFVKEKRFGEAERSLAQAREIAKGLKLNLNLAEVYEDIDFQRHREKNKTPSKEIRKRNESQHEHDSTEGGHGHGGGGHGHGDALPPINLEDHSIPLNLPKD